MQKEETYRDHQNWTDSMPKYIVCVWMINQCHYGREGNDPVSLGDLNGRGERKRQQNRTNERLHPKR